MDIRDYIRDGRFWDKAVTVRTIFHRGNNAPYLDLAEAEARCAMYDVSLGATPTTFLQSTHREMADVLKPRYVRLANAAAW